MTKKSSASPSQEYWIYENLHRALEIALYYGFTPIANINPDKNDIEQSKGLTSTSTSISIRPEEIISLIRKQYEKNQHLAPLMFFRERKPEKRDPKKVECSLDIIGTTRGIADATVIKVAYETLRAEGHENLEIEVNSLGDRDSLNRFARELTNYFKKNFSVMHADCKQAIKKDVFAALTCSHEKCKEIVALAPHPINFLSEPSRSHFKEVLEHLETVHLPYTLNPGLVDGHEFASHTLFRIIIREENKEPIVLATGARWSGFGKKLGLKKDIQGISVVFPIKRPVETKGAKKIRKPQFYFIQMGPEAKLKSLLVIETLRIARIPLYHALTKDKLTAQLSSAEYLKVPYILIMGQKESIENTVLVREMNNRSQETVHINLIADYLKKLIS